MAIVETKVKVRPTASKEFFSNTPEASPIIAGIKASVQDLYDSGKYTKVETYPDTVGNLELKQINTFADFETFGRIDTSKGITLDTAFINYYSEEDFSHPAEPTIANVYYKLEGIDSTFYATTVYSFPTENDSYIPIMTRSLEIAYDHKGKLVDTIVTSNSITVVHQYNNAEDFTATHFKDLLAYVPQLSAKNATRTITYTDGTYSK